MSSRTRPRLAGRFLAGTTAAALGLAASLFVLAGPAQAADTVKAQLSLTGIATSDNPTGGSTVGLHPGDSITISPSTVPTEGLRKLGLADLLSGVTSLLASYQVEADFSGLPSGAKDTTLKTGQSKTFTFPKAGTYSFTWSAQSIGLLGVVPINLDGNQLAQAGVELNAKNQYVGKIVVATDPPKGGISLQLPGTSVQPKVGGISLPKVSLPGVTTPTIPTSLPNLNSGGSGSSSGGSSSSSGGSSSSSGGKSTTVALPVPALVVPQGTGQVIGSTSGYGYGAASSGSGSSDSSAGLTGSTFGTPAATSSHATRAATKSEPAAKTIAEPAASRPAATSGMPVVLAVVAVIALVLVAGTYARLFLLGRGSSTSS